MQQLTIEHNNTTTNQVVKNTVKMKNRREGKGRVLALSRNVFRLQNKSSHIYYVESESRDDLITLQNLNQMFSNDIVHAKTILHDI